MPMRIGDAVPSFDGATEWLNEMSESIGKNANDFITGTPALVYFWSASCGICKENMPKLTELKNKFVGQGLKTIAIHMPRYEADTDLDAVKATIEKYSINDLCAVDNEHKLKDAFLNEQGWVPVYYLFDAEGKLKSRAAGEFGIGVVTSALEKMFAPKTAIA